MAGSVHVDDEPVAESLITLTQAGVTYRACTDGEGRYRIYLPQRESSVVVELDRTGLPSPVYWEGTEVATGVVGPGEGEFGLTDSKVVNWHLASDQD